MLTRTQGKRFEDMFPVKIASKATSLKGPISPFIEVGFKRFLTQTVKMNELLSPAALASQVICQFSGFSTWLSNYAP